MAFRAAGRQNVRGLVFDIAHFTVHDGPGIRTTVFMKGCPLRCIWCHNPEGIDRQPQLSYTHAKCISCGDCIGSCPENAICFADDNLHIDRQKCLVCGRCTQACRPEALFLYGREFTVTDLLPEILADREFYRQSGGGVTLSGGEPLLQPDFCASFLAACQAEKLHTALDTCGAVPFSDFEAVLPHINLVLYDLKHIDSAVHRRLTGLGNELILQNLRRLGQLSVPLEVRIPCLPTLNDGIIMQRMADFLSDIPSLLQVRLLPYHDLARSKYRAIGIPDNMPHIGKPDAKTMRGLQEIISRQGLKVVL